MTHFAFLPGWHFNPKQSLIPLVLGAVLCIAGDDSENAPSAAGGTSSAQEILGSTGTGIDLAKAHL